MMSPVQILGRGTTEDRGENARLNCFAGTHVITDLMKTTLGPKGMDKILTSMSNPEEVKVTNDGATILKSLLIDNPAARIMIEISKTQDDEVGDGTTSVCVLAGELLRQAEKLLESGIHPQTVIQGWRMASACARKRLSEIAEINDRSSETFRQNLLNVAQTTLCSKMLHHDKGYFASLAVDAVLRLRGDIDLESINIIQKRGGGLGDSYLEDGFILEKRISNQWPSKRIENAKILIANTPMDTDRIKIFGAKVKTDSVDVEAEIEKEERERMRRKCDKIASHGCNVFINRQLIYNLPEEHLASKGIMTIEHSDFEGCERLFKFLGGDIVSTFDNPDKVVLGECKLIEEVMIGEDKVVRFSGGKGGEACTIVLRGASTQMLGEAERSLHDALCVVATTVKSNKLVYGGGATEVEMANSVDELAAQTEGKKALAVASFADALRQIPAILAMNAGYDSAELVAQLKARHREPNNVWAGIDMESGQVGDMKKLSITESFRVKEQVVISASEAAEMILRVDDVIKAAPRQREQDPRYPH